MSKKRAKQDEYRKHIADVRRGMEKLARWMGKKLKRPTDKQVLHFVDWYFKTEQGKQLLRLHAFKGKGKPH